MTCQELASYIDAFLDDELSVGENLRIQAHLVFCELCRQVVASEVKLRNLIEADTFEDFAPGSLRERIVEQAREQPAGGVVRALRPSAASHRRFVTGLLTGVGAAAAILGFMFLLLMGGPGDTPPLAAEVLAKHGMYSRAPELLQIASSQPTELARWFRERVHFPLKLPLLARPGDRLIGGRLSSVGDSQAAYLIYARDGRRLSLFIFKVLPGLPRPGMAKQVEGLPFYTATLQNRAVVWWEDGEVYYAVTGDGEVEDLIDFALLCIKGRTLRVS